MVWFFDFIQLEVTWLDEVAEGLKHVITASHEYRNWVDSLPLELHSKLKALSSFKTIIETMRAFLYTTGVVAHQLILPRDSRSEEEKKKEETEQKKVDLKNLVLLHGGLESRFIPELSEKTKLLIEGFFKITNDVSLRDLALKRADEVQWTDDDKLLSHIAEEPTAGEEKSASLDGVDYVELTLSVLQHVVLKKKGPVLRVGGQDGHRLTRAAFAVILKFSELLDVFRTVLD